MKEWNTSENRWDGQDNVEDRLTAYYGPELPAQPLPPLSWMRLSSRLPQQQSLRCRMFRFMKKSRRRRRFAYGSGLSYNSVVPAYIQEAFADIMHEARLPYRPDMLRCTYNNHSQLPAVRVSYWRKRRIHLALPASLSQPLEPAELKVLLASGLAMRQLLFEYKLPFGLLRMVIIWTCLLTLLVLIAVGGQHFDAMVLPIAATFVTILLFTLVVSHRRGRALAFRVDALMVLWLGRNQVCEGLHALVRRSRHPYRRSFGQISFAERIERVCGTRVTPQNEHLTLVH